MEQFGTPITLSGFITLIYYIIENIINLFQNCLINALFKEHIEIALLYPQF